MKRRLHSKKSIDPIATHPVIAKCTLSVVATDDERSRKEDQSDVQGISQDPEQLQRPPQQTQSQLPLAQTTVNKISSTKNLTQWKFRLQTKDGSPPVGSFVYFRLSALLVRFLLISLSFAGVRGQRQRATKSFTLLSLRQLQAQSTSAPTAASASSSTPAPTRTRLPTKNPSSTTTSPSISPKPTIVVTQAPSRTPSFAPSSVPVSLSRRRYQQSFVVTNVTFFSEQQTLQLMSLYQSYTPILVPSISANITTTCDMLVTDQSISSPIVNNQTQDQNDISFTCTYESVTVNTTSLPNKLLVFLNDATQRHNITITLRDLGFPVLDTQDTVFSVVITPSPTISAAPSHPPSSSPTRTATPSTIIPTLLPTTKFAPTARPTDSSLPPTNTPPNAGNGNNNQKLPVAVIASLTVLAGVAILVGLVVYYQRSKRKRFPNNAPPRTTARPGRIGLGGELDPELSADGFDTGYGMEKAGADGVLGAIISQGGASVNSNNSLLSAGSGMGDESVDEFDGAKHLQDEFDQYKDQNLEILRSNVEGNLTGFEGIMSAAVTKALMGEETAKLDPADLMWGCQGAPTGEEIEASALCEVSDWLKRNETSPVERKRAFMQDLLNKMVASVRYGVLGADDASRTIHESAALLGLQIANELPMTTVIISGMRKTVQAAELIKAMREFGDIDTAAVAPGLKGFGIVRFRHPKSVERAMRRYRTTEIVVQDVAVQMKVLMPSGEVQSRT